MEAEGILTALAEVAIAIAGFSGIVVALQRRGEPWSQLDRNRFSALLEISLACVFWSFVPIVFHLSKAPAASVWFWSSSLWLVYIAAAAAHRLSRFRRAKRLDPDQPSRALLAFGIALLSISVLAQAANVVWLRASWPHVLVVLLGLLHCCILFFRLLRRVVVPAA